jgi:hypothetical protein
VTIIFISILPIQQENIRCGSNNLSFLSFPSPTTTLRCQSPRPEGGRAAGLRQTRCCSPRPEGEQIASPLPSGLGRASPLLEGGRAHCERCRFLRGQGWAPSRTKGKRARRGAATSVWQREGSAANERASSVAAPCGRGWAPMRSEGG